MRCGYGGSGIHQFAGLLEAAPDAMVCVDGGGKITLVNAQTERLFGYHRGELTGQQVEILVPDEARTVHHSHRDGYAADPRPRPMGAGMELAGRRKDGTTFPAEISLAAVDTDDGILITAAVRDITDRLQAQAERERLKNQAEWNRLERQLQQAQRLESLSTTCSPTSATSSRSWSTSPLTPATPCRTAGNSPSKPATSTSTPPTPPPDPEQPPAPKPEPGNGEHVLLVEDEAAIREVTCRILTRNGYQVTAAADGHEAIQAAGPHSHIDILLTDVVMPGMQGKQVAAHITAFRPGIPVLFMSGYTQGLLSAQGILEPGINLIEKPFSETTLLGKLRELLHPPAAPGQPHPPGR